MPALPNSQEERFCQEVAKGASQTEAAKLAGFNQAQAHNIGCRLRKREDIDGRIRELSQRVEANEIADKEWIVAELLENHRLARKTGNLSESRLSLELFSRLQGHFVNRTESRSESIKVSLDSADVKQAKVLLRQSARKLPLAECEALLLEEAPEEQREELREAIEGESRRPN